MITTFAELGLNEQILAGVDALGFETPTPVQEQAIPLVLEGRDVVASAQTGTGKTAAFTLPTLQLIAAMAQAAPEGQGDADVTPTDVRPEGAPAATERPDESQPTDDEAPHEGDGGSEELAAPDDAGKEIVATMTDDAPAVSDDSGTSEEPKPRRRRRRRRRRRKGAGAEQGDVQATAAKDQDVGIKTTAGDTAMAVEDNASTSGSASRDTTSSRDARPTGQDAPGRSRRRRRRRRKGKGPVEETTIARPKRPAAPLALVVTPTRELAQQIERVAEVVCSHTGQRAVIVMGGARFERQIEQLQQGCDLLVATPGRLIDLMERKIVDLSDVRILVLDEADRMLDMGFWPSVRRIMQALPSERQNLLFSATIPPSIKGTIDAMLHDPATVEIARIGETADTVEERLCPVTQGQKTQLLKALVEHGNPERVLVFCRTKHRVDDVSKTLKSSGLKVEVMHADRPQKARDKALERFREGQVQLLVATDVMSRGIDVSGIDAVVNYDVPMDPEDYVHRIGRTGRAGHTGHAYTFVAPDEISPLREIEYFTHKLVPVWDLEGFSYDEGRIVPNPARSTSKPTRTMFSGSRARMRGPRGGRFGRHY